MARNIASVLCANLLVIALTVTLCSAGTVTCDLVNGDLAISSISASAVAGSFSGDVEGTLATVVTNVYHYPTPWGFAKILRGHSVITTAAGTLTTNDRILIYPYHGHRYWASRHVISGGTGAYEDHRGRIVARGQVMAGPTAQLHYHGAICEVTAP